MSRAYKKIGLLDHLGHGNLGDDATLDAVMHNIKSRWPSSMIIGFSLNPFDTHKRHGIPSYAIRRDSQLPPASHKSAPSKVGLKSKLKSLFSTYRPLFAILRTINTIVIRMPRAFLQELFFLAESFRIIRSLDLFVICGGGQLLDSWGGPWQFPYTLFKWILLNKLAHVTCYFINVGAGPLDHPLSRRFVKYALLLSDYASFRDDQSRKLAKEIGFTGRAEVLADSVYSLAIPACNTSRIATRGESIIGFSPMAYCDPRVYWDKNRSVYDCYTRKLALFGSWLIRHHHHLTLFSTDIWFDSQAIEDLKIALHNAPDIANSPYIRHEPIEGLEGLLSAMSSMDYIITCRYHGIVFAHMMNIPVLAISHHQKVATLMNDVGLSDYCVDIRTFDVELLKSAFIRMVDNKDRIKARMATTAACYRKAVSTQFDQLFYQQAAVDSFGRCAHEYL